MATVATKQNKNKENYDKILTRFKNLNFFCGDIVWWRCTFTNFEMLFGSKRNQFKLTENLKEKN